MGVLIMGLLRVANGHELFCSHFSPSFIWEMGNNQFHFDLKWLQVKGCDIVLGMDWINSVAPLILHTKPHSISFMKDGRFLTLIDSRDAIKIAPAKAKSIQKLLKSSYCSFLALAQFNALEEVAKTFLDQAQMEQLVSKFEDLFKEPSGLSPKRDCDHAVDLVPGATTVNQRPYRYSFKQKNTIKKMVQDMLKQNTLVPNSSPFASPVILVKKKGLILAHLDLRSGYHQICMEGDEFKTAFRTHHGLCVSALEHLTHLEKVFEVLQANQLFAKRSKCNFGRDKIEYLDHIISSGGASTDESKVEAILNWAGPKWAFVWSEEAMQAFEALKQAMVQAPQGRPLAFLSQALSSKHLGLSTYEKGLVALLKGVEIIAADALSHRFDEEAECKSISVVYPLWVQEVLASYEGDSEIMAAMAKLALDPNVIPNVSLQQGSLRHKGQIWVGSTGQKRQQLIEAMHTTAWYENVTLAKGTREKIWLIQDYFSLFLSLQGHGNTSQWISLKDYQNPGEISNICVSGSFYQRPDFYKPILERVVNGLGVQIKLSSAYHLQTNGQTERLNRCLEGYLRCMTGHKPAAWSKWLSLAEFWYNTTFHSAIQMSPFKTLYGYDPPQPTFELVAKSKVNSVDELLREK
uniref:Integrase catalytic domain-containing protein n=1 Tax=Nicotiana tabacum TaxID=4097 RepID=A0A1S3Y9E0_TOBAC|nr:PREDICTED: uncharacterized protein LOC107773757 [Nicotiana tabacum]